MRLGQALQPFLTNLQSRFQTARDEGREQEQEMYRRTRQEQQDKLAAEELERRLQRQQMEDVLKVLQVTGQTDDAGAQVLQKGGMGGLVESNAPRMQGTQGPWGTANLDSGGQTPSWQVRKSPEQREEDYDTSMNRIMSRQKAQRDMEMPGLLAEVFAKHPTASLQELAPVLMASGMSPKDYLTMTQTQDYRNNQLSLNRERLNLAKQRMNQVNQPSPTDQRNQQTMQAEQALLDALLDIDPETLEESGGYEGLAQNVLEDPEFGYNDRIRGLFIQELRKRARQ